MSYAEPDDLFERFDWREIGEAVSDENNRGTLAELQADSKVLTALSDASGEVESALIVGGNYTVDQLGELSGNSLSRLKHIVCQIAMANIMARRSGGNLERYETLLKLANETLDRLRKGENILNLPGKAEAGAPQVGGYSTLQIQNLNLVRDRTRNYFPQRSLPGNR